MVTVVWVRQGRGRSGDALHNGRARWALSVACFALAVVTAVGCTPKPSIPKERIVEVREGRITRGVIAVGRVEPRTRVELKSKANGILQKLHVDVSDTVTAGQVLAELDREILESRVAEAEGKLAQARASVDLANADLKQLELEKDDPEFLFAKKNWERLQKLAEDEIASEEELETGLERKTKAEYRYRIVESRYEGALATVAAAKGALAESEALAARARQELAEAKIVSPIDGVVLYRYLEEGDAVSSIRVAGGNATVIMTLGDLSELYVDGEVDEIDVGRIIDGQRAKEALSARVTIESYKSREFFGRVTRVTPLGLEDENGIVTFEVRIVFDNPERLLLANMTANSQIIIEEKENALLVSQGALLTEGKKRFLEVYDPAKAEAVRREVKIGITDGAQVEVESGIAKGERIVLP